MEPANRWKCCTALNFSSGMCVCVHETPGMRGPRVSVTPSWERCPSCSIIFSFDSHYSLSPAIWEAKPVRRELSLSLSLFAPADITDQQPFSTRQAEEAQICNISTWCNYSSFYLRELLRPLLNTTDIGECKITEEAAAVIWQWQNEAICLGEVWIQLGAEINSHVMR